MMNVLRKMVGKNIPEPASILVPRWFLDRFYMGCYSNWPRQLWTMESLLLIVMYRLINNIGRVYFTGEHTHDKYYGWVTGAYFAGIATAEDLMNMNTSACDEHDMVGDVTFD
ncbi:Polyamine oxidase 1 [Linum grandiflorum]